MKNHEISCTAESLKEYKEIIYAIKYIDEKKYFGITLGLSKTFLGIKIPFNSWDPIFFYPDMEILKKLLEREKTKIENRLNRLGVNLEKVKIDD